MKIMKMMMRYLINQAIDKVQESPRKVTFVSLKKRLNKHINLNNDKLYFYWEYT